MYVPTKVFFTKGVGTHKEKLQSFEKALRDAQIEKYNLVRVSSIFPPHCKVVTRAKGNSHAAARRDRALRARRAGDERAEPPAALPRSASRGPRTRRSTATSRSTTASG